MAVETSWEDGDIPGALNALEYAATVILLELAMERGKGPWFGGLLQRIQFAVAKSKAPDGAPDAVKERWFDAGDRAVDSVFKRVLLDPDVPDWRPRISKDN